MYTVNAKVIDSQSRRPMYRVNVYVSDASGNPVEHNGVPNVGRMTGKDGKFTIPVAFEEDFITLSYVGYQRLTIPAESAAKKSQFIMRTVAQDLPEVNINTTRPAIPAVSPDNTLQASMPMPSKKAWLIIGAVAGLALIGGVIYWFLNKKK